MSGFRNKFLNRVPNTYDVGIITKANVIEGRAGTTTLGAYQYMSTVATFTQCVYLREVLWEVIGGVTYTLTIGGVGYGSILAGAGTVTLSWFPKRMIYGTPVTFRLDRSSDGNMRDAGLGAYNGTYFRLPALYDYEGGTNGRVAPIKVDVRPLLFEVF